MRTILSATIATTPTAAPAARVRQRRRICDDRGETQRQRVGAAAGQRGFDGQRRGTEQRRSGRRLQLRRRQEDMGADPRQAEQAEQRQRPADQPKREANPG